MLASLASTLDPMVLFDEVKLLRSQLQEGPSINTKNRVPESASWARIAGDVFRRIQEWLASILKCAQKDLHCHSILVPVGWSVHRRQMRSESEDRSNGRQSFEEMRHPKALAHDCETSAGVATLSSCHAWSTQKGSNVQHRL